MASPFKSRLGRGLGAIISGGGNPASPADARSPAAEENPAGVQPPPSAPEAQPEPAVPNTGNGVGGYRDIAVADVLPNPFQPRSEFSPEHIKELAESIRAEGLLQPIVVRAADGKYQLIAGERRWRAFQELRLKTIPARVVSVGDASAATMAMIENLQREGLNPIEEAHGYASLIRDFDLTQGQVAQRVAKGRATVANSLRLLMLAAEVQGFLGSGMISPGHAKALLGIEEKEEQVALARRIVADGLSVRAAEALVARHRPGKSSRSSGPRSTPAGEAAAIADIEKRLRSHLNTKVKLRHARRKGRILIDYAGNDDLRRILEKIGVPD